jgi:hypothetical protein
MNKGYNIRNGGFGNVKAMVTEQTMLNNQAVISNTHLTGLSRQSSTT